MLLLGLRRHLMRNQSFWVRGESLQLLVFNEEFLVSASHRLALTTSTPFVHTARRSYRLNGPVKCSDRGDVGGSLPATSREVHEPYHLEEGEVVTRFP
ncbi:unnamed protein product [Prunus brigantina]